MKHILTILFAFTFTVSFGQVEVSLFQKEATATTSQIGVRIRSTGGPVDYIGVSFYILYQSANAAPQSTAQNSVVGVDDSKMVTTFGWGVGARNTNPALAVTMDPGAPGGQTYNRMYIYGNSDETGGSNIRSITNQWDTLLYITLNTLQPAYPQGGYAYMLATTENPGAALSDPFFLQFPFAVNGGGDLPLGDLGTVPVLFSQFDAKCSGNGTLISWATAQEANSDYFEVQRSRDGSTWKTIGRTPAAGNSSISRSYNQLDLEAGNALYRIKQVDKDGQAIYTNIERANCEVKNISSVIYPVPAKDVLNVVIKSDRAVRTQLMIFEISGKLVKKLDANVQNGTNNFRIDLKGLTSGDYIIRSSDEGIELNKQFSVIR
jgi:hypothetical protein